MKKNKLLYNCMALGVAAWVLSGCGDAFLDTSSKTTLNSGSFYQNEVQAQYAVIGCYDGYQRTVSNGSWPTLFQAVETMSDDCLGGGGPDDRADRLMDRFDMSYMSSQIDLFNGLWGDYYQGIYRCNMLINSLDNIAWSSEDARLVVESEARALRGLMYFDLLRLFENVPLLLEATDEIIPQAAPDDVYAQVVTDLKFAADNMPAGQYAEVNERIVDEVQGEACLPARLEGEARARIFLVKARQGFGYDVGRNAVGSGERNFPLVFRPAPAAHLAADFLHQIEHGDGLFMEQASFLREFHALVPAVEKLHAELLLKALDKIAHGGLPEMQAFRRLRHVAVFRHGVEAAQPLKKVSAEWLYHDVFPRQNALRPHPVPQRGAFSGHRDLLLKRSIYQSVNFINNCFDKKFFRVIQQP